jgi:signal transduction histidine kinase
LLLVILATLFGSGAYGLYSYRSLVKSLKGRSPEIPLATNLIQHASAMRTALSRASDRYELRIVADPTAEDPNRLEMRDQFQASLDAFNTTLAEYRIEREKNAWRVDSRISDAKEQRVTLAKIDAVVEELALLDDRREPLWDERVVGQMTAEVDELQSLATELHSYLYQQLKDLADEVRQQYRAAIVLMWIAALATLLLLALWVRLFYTWIFRPLRILIAGSRAVASGRFHHRIELETHDEMSELSDALNEMTARFRAVRDDLDRQVQIRTRQVVRNEQLASVGFLAAGVAHEINNPLASIAMCAESLEGRLAGRLDHDDPESTLATNYLRMIQDEAFRCKQITERLLDFSRTGDVRRQTTELRELIAGVIEMVGHLGRYRNKRVALLAGDSIHCEVNPQEIKQVVLNLITNGLDSLDEYGEVRVRVVRHDHHAEIVVEDDGCGMSDEVLEHLFEPFFTRRRGGQGTGLGLSITYRIVQDHGGEIEAASAGPGKGSRLTVSLPLVDAHKESQHRYQIAS